MSESPKEENIAKRAKLDAPDAGENSKAEAASTAVPVGFGTFGGGAVGFGGVASSGTGWLKAPTLGGAKPAFGSGFGSSSGGFGSFGSGSGALGGSVFGGSALNSDLKTGAPGLTSTQVPTTFKFSAQPAGVGADSKDASPRDTNGDEGGEENSEKTAEEGDDKSGDEGEASTNAWSDIAAAPVLKTSSVELPTEEATSQATGEEGEEMVFGLRAKLYELKRKPTKPVPDANTPKTTDEGAEKKGSEATQAGNAGASSGAADEGSDSSSSSGAGSSLPAFEWRECGVGHLRVLSPASPFSASEAACSKEGKAAAAEETQQQQRAAGRVVMRREKTEALILNVSVRGMAATTAGDKAVQFTCFKVVDEDDEKATAADGSSVSESTTPVACTYLVKTKTKDEARDLLAATKAQIEAVGDDAATP